MSRSLTVLAVAEDSVGAPDCADDWVCQEPLDRFGADWLAENARRVGRDLRVRLEERFVAEGIRTPRARPLLAGASSGTTGVR